MASENPPEFFHLLIGQCLYKKWADAETQEEIDELISKIEAGELYVSMECYFKNIAYYVTSPNKENYVVARNEETSFLTKHLRAYGGTGSYNDYSVARYLIDLSFSAVGIVENPANKYSVIFPANSEHIFGKAKKIDNFNDVFKNQGVYLSSNEKQREKSMADVDKNLEKINELTAALEAANKKNSELEASVNKAAQEKHSAELAELNKTVEADKKALDEANAKVEQYTKEVASVKEALKVESEAKAKLNDELAAIKAADENKKKKKKLTS